MFNLHGGLASIYKRNFGFKQIFTPRNFGKLFLQIESCFEHKKSYRGSMHTWNDLTMTSKFLTKIR